MYESSGLHFFRTKIVIQSGPNIFDKSRLVITFFTNLEVTEILCILRLVLELKADERYLSGQD